MPLCPYVPNVPMTLMSLCSYVPISLIYNPVENHTKNNCLKIHSSELDKNHKFISPNRKIIYDEDPSHQDLCDNEQEFFYDSIINNKDLKSHMEDAFKSLQIALACDEAVKKSNTVFLD